jgi:hypothetical protein
MQIITSTRKKCRLIIGATQILIHVSLETKEVNTFCDLLLWRINGSSLPFVALLYGFEFSLAKAINSSIDEDYYKHTDIHFGMNTISLYCVLLFSSFYFLINKCKANQPFIYFLYINIRCILIY